MADTRRAMRALEGTGVDVELVKSLLASNSEAEATIAFTLLRGTLDDGDLLMLANLREVLAEMPAVPFRTGECLDMLAQASGYEDTGHSYRRLFETSAGVFGVEFTGREHECEEIVIHTPGARGMLRSANGELNRDMLELFVRHGILLDALLEALALLGLPLEPTIYLSADDFISEHGAATARDTLEKLF